MLAFIYQLYICLSNMYLFLNYLSTYQNLIYINVTLAYRIYCKQDTKGYNFCVWGGISKPSIHCYLWYCTKSDRKFFSNTNMQSLFYWFLFLFLTQIYLYILQIFKINISNHFFSTKSTIYISKFNLYTLYVNTIYQLIYLPFPFLFQVVPEEAPEHRIAAPCLWNLKILHNNLERISFNKKYIFSRTREQF